MWLARAAIALTLAGTAVAVTADADGTGRPPCFGAASRDPLERCVNPKLRFTVVPSPSEALDAPNAPCEPVAGDPYRCTFGSPAEDADGTVALIGDSHATHWRSALLTVAARHHWQGISLTRSSCPYTQATPVLPEPAARECVEWNRQVSRFVEDHPEIGTVVLSQHRGKVVAPAGSNPRLVQIRGYVDAWKALPASVRHIIVIRDPPYDRLRGGSCIDEASRRHEDVGLVCAVPRSRALKSDPAAQAVRQAGDPRVGLVDLTPFFCSRQLCFPVVGGALVHKDTTHLTLTFGTTLGPYLLRAIDALLGR